METQRVNYGAWLLRLLTWDGLLPAIVVLVPAVIKQMMPHRGQVTELVGIAMPMAAFGVRLFIAYRHICSNHCTPDVRHVQFVFLVVAAIVLLLFDTMLILAQEMPAGAMFATDVDMMLWVGLFGAYLACMAVAMYPGRTEETTNYDPFDSFADR